MDGGETQITAAVAGGHLRGPQLSCGTCVAGWSHRYCWSKCSLLPLISREQTGQCQEGGRAVQQVPTRTHRGYVVEPAVQPLREECRLGRNQFLIGHHMWALLHGGSLGGGNKCGTNEACSESEICIRNLAHIDSKCNFPQLSGNASWSREIVCLSNEVPKWWCKSQDVCVIFDSSCPAF